jgi:hypothetical protein
MFSMVSSRSLASLRLVCPRELRLPMRWRVTSRSGTLVLNARTPGSPESANPQHAASCVQMKRGGPAGLRKGSGSGRRGGLMPLAERVGTSTRPARHLASGELGDPGVSHARHGGRPHTRSGGTRARNGAIITKIRLIVLVGRHRGGSALPGEQR